MSIFSKKPKLPMKPSPPPGPSPLLLPNAYFRSPTSVPAAYVMHQEILRFHLPLVWQPGKEMAISRICLEPDASYVPLLSFKPGSRASRGRFVIQCEPRPRLELDALALMDSCIHGQAQQDSDRLPDLVGDLSARLVKLANGDELVAGGAVGLIVDFIQSHAGVRGEGLKVPFMIEKGDVVRAWVEQPRGDTYVVLYGISKTSVPAAQGVGPR